jgi:spore coat polysaccharide biosynthesis protein SpsF
MRTIAITQARTGSTRFPGKVLMKLGSQSLLELHLQRILKSKKIDEVILATTTKPEDAVLADIGRRANVATSRGSETDVLDRFYQAVVGKSADYIVRLTSDCPLIDACLIDRIIEYTLEKKLDYCSNTLDPTYPDGQDVEVFRFSALEKAWRGARLDSEREHVTPYIWKNSTFKGGDLFSSENFTEGKSFGHQRMTVDELDDLELIKSLVEIMGTDRTWLEYAEYLQENPDLMKLNKQITRNEGYTKSVRKDKNI